MSRRYGYMFRHLKTSFMPRKDFKAITNGVHATLNKVVQPMIDHNTNDFMKNNLPRVVAKAIKRERQNVKKEITNMVVEVVQKERANIRAELSGQIKFKRPTPLVETCRTVVVRTRGHEDHHEDDARPKGESKQLEDFDAWLNEKGINDDEVPTEEVSPKLLAEVSEKEMTSDDIQRMHNESREEDLTVQIPKKPSPVYLTCARNPKIPPMSLVNQDLFYLKYGNSGTRKYIPSLYKIHAIPFPENDLEELNTIWVKKTIKRPEYMTKIVVKRVNDEYLEFVESDYKYLHKNDIEDISCVYWERIHDYQLGMEIGLIYENNKKEKREIVIKEIPKFCDATLKRVLENVKKFNLDVKHDYADPNLNDEDA
ncbi:hypothetical protein Tco_1092219 [Tanacetum coccineum]|uniref:Uncharacterized protein n=1 Tax=Tanacetum coccineum TaxID=301880 RepID=A0ABQ5IAF7_9ASTR